MKKATIETSMGSITLELDDAKAPVTVANFLAYAKDGHYDGTIFHRVIDGFMIQGGGFTKAMDQKPTKAPIKNEAARGLGGDVNLLKGAIVTADAVTAVSPTYAQELKYAYFAHGLENVMSMNARKLHGVLNGIDMQRYDPSRDKSLAAAYSPDDLAGKKKDKAALQRVLGLQERPDTPILAMVTRLVSHKGLDLVCETLDAFMGKDVQFVVLGKGDAKYETFFEYAKQRYGGRMAVYLGYSEQLAMQIYAGADLFLMPSKSEPCGLSQMIAMRYGAVPIVRETGGLKDTVHAYEAWNGQGNGFTFANYNAGDMCHVICEAIDLYHDNKGAYAMLQQRGMTADFSWTRSAQEYRNIYESICR